MLCKSKISGLAIAFNQSDAMVMHLNLNHCRCHAACRSSLRYMSRFKINAYICFDLSFIIIEIVVGKLFS